MNGTTQPEQETDTTALHSDPWRLQAIFFEPGRVFEEINQRPDWVLPLILILLIGLISFNFLLSSMGWESVARQQVSQNPQFQNASAEERQVILDRTANSQFLRVFMRLAPLLAPIFLLLVAGLLFGVMIMSGKEARFKKVFSVICHSYYAVGLVSGILLVVVTALAEDPGSLDMQNPVQANLAFLASQSRAQNFFLSQLDLFTFYRIFLLSLGLSKIVRKLTMGGALAIVVGLWAFYVLLFTGVTYLFAG